MTSKPNLHEVVVNSIAQLRVECGAVIVGRLHEQLDQGSGGAVHSQRVGRRGVEVDAAPAWYVRMGAA